jgi:hypothetical protein
MSGLKRRVEPDKRTSAAKAEHSRGTYGTAKAVPLRCVKYFKNSLQGGSGADDEAGDVVGTAALFGEFDQALAYCLDRV